MWEESQVKPLAPHGVASRRCERIVRTALCYRRQASGDEALRRTAMPRISRSPHWVLCCLLCVVLPAMAGRARGDARTDSITLDESASGRVGIALHAETATPPWLAAALERTIVRALSHYEQLSILVASPTTAACAHDTTCIVNAFAREGADAVFLGTVKGGEIEWVLYEASTNKPVENGTITLKHGASLVSLKQATLRAFAPLLMRGGLFDQARGGATAQARTKNVAHARSEATQTAWLLVVLALFTSAPLILGSFALQEDRARLARLPVVWASAASTVGLIVVALLVLVEQIPARTLIEPSAALASLWGLFSGIAWGIVFWMAATYVVPPLSGFERVAPRDVTRLVWHALYATLQRSLLLLVAATPLVVWLSALASVWELPSSALWLGPAPVVALLAWLTLATWVACLTPVLDAAFVEGEVSRDNPWHHEVHKYFMGYVKRSGWDLDPELLSRVVFVPGRGEGVVSYGGAGSPARIVVSSALLKLAMSEPEQAKVNTAGDVVLPDWSLGVLFATTAKSGNAALQGMFAPPPPAARSFVTDEARRPIGQAATLLGYVMPAPAGEVPPLISDDSSDLQVVRELLAEHYPWTAQDPDEEDDDTDPTHRDFLFGVLVHELGALVRGDLTLHTLLLALRHQLREAAPPIRTAFMHMQKACRLVFWHHTRRIADAYTALHFGHHHFIQYLYFRLTEDRKLLTARASEGSLRRTSARMLATLQAQAPADGDGERQLQDEAAWLALFFTSQVPSARQRRIRKIIMLAACAFLLTAFGVSAKQSADYHTQYERTRAASRKPSDNDRASPTTTGTETKDHGE